MRFHKRYFLYSILLLGIEFLIALYVRDAIIRPYGGDFLAVILLYYIIRSFWNGSSLTVAIGVLAFAYTVETLQYLKVVNLLGLQDNHLAKIIIGTSFDWGDMLAYTLGVLIVYWVEEVSKEKG